MELYNYQNVNNRQQRKHYKSKSAAAVLSTSCLSHSKIIPFRPRTETPSNNKRSNVNTMIPGHLELIQGYNSNSHRNIKKHIHKQKHRHYKNSKTVHNIQNLNSNFHKHQSNHSSSHVSSSNSRIIPNIQLPIDNQNNIYTNYKVPKNTPYHTPHQISEIASHTNINHKRRESLPLSLKALSTSNASGNHRLSLSLSDTPSTNGIGIDNISNIGVYSRRSRSRSRSSRSRSNRNSSPIDIIDNKEDISIRILESISSISSLSLIKQGNQLANIRKLGVPIKYIDSFKNYFGHNTKELGHGGQGSIYKINETHVIKSYVYTSLGLYREIFALKYILNKDIELYIESHRNKEKKAYIKFPLINGENLLEYSQDLINNKKTSLRECHLQALFAQLFGRLYDLHSKGLIHRDIKIENVMVKFDGSIEFIDFGHAIYIGKDLNCDKYKDYKLKWIRGKTEIFGTDCVLSPELKYAFYELNNNEYILYGTEIDFYSIGMMGCEIIYNQFDHSYQHNKWIKLLKNDIKLHGNLSGLSIKCLQFLLGLIETNPLNRLSINDILTHPFLTEEIKDKLGYNNWYSNDSNGIPYLEIDADDDNDSIKSLPNNNNNDRNQTIDIIIKQELIKHKITLICNGLMNNKVSYYPRMQHLNKLINIIKDNVYDCGNIAQFIFKQFKNAFDFQLKNYNPIKTTNNIEKITKKKLSLHKKLYQVIFEFINSYKIEFIPNLNSYINIIINNSIHFTYAMSLMHKIIKIYSLFTKQTCLIILRCINKYIKQLNNTNQIRIKCISFLKYILTQKDIMSKKNNNILILKEPIILSLIQSIIKYGLNDSNINIKTECKSLLSILNIKPPSNHNHININYNLYMKKNRIKKQINKTHKINKQIKSNKNKNNHYKQNKSMDVMSKRRSKSSKNKKQKSKLRSRNKHKNYTHINSMNNIRNNIHNNIHHNIHNNIHHNIHNNNGFVRESYSELAHLDDICASADDKST